MSTQAIWQHIGITWSGVVGVIIATTVLYVLFTSLLRRVGPRLMAGGSTLSTALLTVLGALCARAMLGDSPTLFGAVTALATLFVLEAALGSLGRLSPLKRAPRFHPKRARLVIRDGEVYAAALAARGLSEPALWARLRTAGVRHRDEVRLVILEGNGSLTVVRRGESIDPELLVGVAGAESLERPE